MIIRPEGIAIGPSTALRESAPRFRVSWWQVGAFLGPGDLCVGETSESLVCSGYRLRGDTLAIATASQNVLIRVSGALNERLSMDSILGKDRSRLGPTAEPSKPPLR